MASAGLVPETDAKRTLNRRCTMKYKELLVLVPCHSLEDFPTELAEEPAASLLNAFSILWHPSLLASTGAFPRWERADEVVSVEPDRLIVVPLPSQEMVPSTWIERARREGSTVIAGEHDREKMLAAALDPLDENPELDPELVADFLALGTVHLQAELLTRHMRNFSHLDEVHMHREATAAAQAAVSGDSGTARTHLQHCFEMLLECRERFYPVDCYLIDLALVTPELAGDALKRLLDSPTPVNLLAQACDWEAVVGGGRGGRAEGQRGRGEEGKRGRGDGGTRGLWIRPPRHQKMQETQGEWQNAIREGIEQKRIEMIGGEYRELPTALMALDSILWQLHQGRLAMQDLFEFAPVTWGRRRFGVGAHLPQILARSGFKAGLHFVLDDGIYPDEEQTQLRWEGADGTALDAFSRIPLAADSAASLIRFPVRMAESMDYDHTAAVVFARWPELKTPWLEDFRRAHRYGPVLGRFTTFADFFEHADSPGRLSEFKAGAYFSPYLVHAVARREANPISRFLHYWERRRRFETADWCRGMAHLLTRGTQHFPVEDSLERTVELAHPEADGEAEQRADRAIRESRETSLAEITRALAPPDADGLLILNPLSFPRKVLIEWPDGTAPGDAEAIRYRQIDSDRAAGVVELPPSGFVWLPSRPASGETTDPGKIPMAEDLVLRNEFFEVQLSDVTGGIAQIRTYRRSPNRISQQVAYRFPSERTITVGSGDQQEVYKTYYSAMRMREARIVSAGPVVGAIETLGDLIDEQNGDVVATYRQVTRVVRGRPTVSVELELATQKVPSGDPWTNYIGCRFAWKHAEAALTASMQQGAHAVTSQRIEAPQYIEIADDNHRTTILTPGLSFHRTTGDRMLDTLLIVEGETERTFRFEIAIDSKFPMQSALDAFVDPIVIPQPAAPGGSPIGGNPESLDDATRQGWFFNVGAANVLMTRILPLRSGEENGFIVRLLETEGKSKVFPLHSLYPPRQARQVDFLGNTINTLKLEGDAATVEIAPHEICDVELTF
jgi:alpha-mannosidase